MLAGATLFAGDSITVGLAPFVKVDGEKFTVAEGGRDSAWLLGAMRSADRAGLLERARNVVVLIGTNDIGGGASVDAIASNVSAVWALALARGLRVFACTVPPVKGWQGFASTLEVVLARRRALNDRIVAGAPSGVSVVRLDQLLADPSDPERLASSFDSGDHLHPRKDALGALLSAQLGANDAPNVVPSLVPGLAFFFVAAAAVVLCRKDLA